MNNQTAVHSPAGSLVGLWPWLGVLLVLLLVGFIRFRLLDMPLERDEGEYAYAGQLILQGIPPYELVYNMKLPGTYFAYAAGMALFGQSAVGVHLTLMVINSLTIVFVFLLGRELFGAIAGLAACASYALTSVSPAVFGMAAHATQFVALFAVPGTLLLWRALFANECRMYFFSGLLFGLAFMMKQPGFYFGLFGMFVMVARAVSMRSVFKRNFAKSFAAMFGGMALPFTFFCVATVVAGDFKQFWFWTIDYALTYATTCTLAQGMERFGFYVRGYYQVYLWLLAMAGIGLLAALRDRSKRRELLFALTFFVFSFLAVTPGLYFREHYFVVLLPAFAVILGMATESLGASFGRMRLVPAVLLAGVLGWNCYLQRQAFFELPPRQLCRVIYGSNPFLESKTVAQYIREHSKPEDRVAVIGSEPEIYFYARRHSATGHIYTYPLMEAQRYATPMQHEMISEIEAAKPKFIVMVMYKLSWLMTKTSDPAITYWAKSYARDSYQKVGVIGREPDGRIVSAFGQDSDDFTGALQEFMILYQRKPDVN